MFFADGVDGPGCLKHCIVGLGGKTWVDEVSKACCENFLPVFRVDNLDCFGDVRASADGDVHKVILYPLP